MDARWMQEKKRADGVTRENRGGGDAVAVANRVVTIALRVL